MLGTTVHSEHNCQCEAARQAIRHVLRVVGGSEPIDKFFEGKIIISITLTSSPNPIISQCYIFVWLNIWQQNLASLIKTIIVIGVN